MLPTAAGLVVLKDGLPPWTTRDRRMGKQRQSAETKGPADAGPEIQSGGVDGKSLTEWLGAVTANLAKWLSAHGQELVNVISKECNSCTDCTWYICGSLNIEVRGIAITCVSSNDSRAKKACGRS